MSLYGEVKGRLPRTPLFLPSPDGGTFEVEFIVDAAFDGELALPAPLARQLGFANQGSRTVFLADGSLIRANFYEIELDWNDETRLTEALELEGNALIGTGLLWEMLVQIELTDGGEVTIEPV